MGRPCSEHFDITITLLAIGLSRAAAMLAQLGAWTQLCVFVATVAMAPSVPRTPGTSSRPTGLINAKDICVC